MPFLFAAAAEYKRKKTSTVFYNRRTRLTPDQTLDDVIEPKQAPTAPQEHEQANANAA